MIGSAPVGSAGLRWARGAIAFGGFLFLAACTTRQPHPATPPETPEAQRLLAALPADARSVGAAYGALRPRVARDLTAVHFEQRDEKGVRTGLTQLEWRFLGDGLEYFQQTLGDPPERPDPERRLRREHGVTVVGNLGSFVYANDMNGWLPWAQALHPLPKDAANPYGSASWSLRSTRMKDGRIELYACRQESERPASELHASFTGRALLYACRSDQVTDWDVMKWYLVDHARFIPAGTREDGLMILTFVPTAVRF